jgi:asparagine synthase (glutamine-hydrolysing)
MCGFAGLITEPGSDGEDLQTRVHRMNAQLLHRGPDDEGTWIDAAAGVALGFRRLSIQDLSPLGAQPMESHSGRFVITFNGEIYNFVELAEELAKRGHSFLGRSDTEVALAAIEEWGIERAVERFVGMFAMAVWDKAKRRITLVRDRLGIKPLYYFWRPGLLLFGSELKALRVDPNFDPTLDQDALCHLLKYLYIPSPMSIFQHVKKLPPGHLLSIDGAEQAPQSPECYWDLRQIARNGMENPLTCTYEEMVSALEEQLTEAIRIRLRADVPLGVLLSGGVDSTTVAALAQTQLGRPLKTFSIGFDNPEHDESPHAKAVSAVIGTEHEQLFLTGQEVLAAVPECSRVYDEPLADPSQLPTFLVSRLAREQVIVALSGDGGDELFGGYNRYIRGPGLISTVSKIPPVFRKPLGGLVTRLRPDRWESLLKRVGIGGKERLLGEKIFKTAAVMRGGSPQEMYLTLLGVGIRSPASVLCGSADLSDILEREDPTYLSDSRARMMLIDQLHYLPGDLLAKVDRASMANSLEVRVPILDHRVVEFSWRVPTEAKINGKTGKRILRDLLYRLVPRELVDRPKVGFTPPTADWLRGPLKEWAADLLAPDRITRQGVFNPQAVTKCWETFLQARDDLTLGVWALVQFQAWAEHYLEN